jgi:hypothetical protein
MVVRDTSMRLLDVIHNSSVFTLHQQRILSFLANNPHSSDREIQRGIGGLDINLVTSTRHFLVCCDVIIEDKVKKICSIGGRKVLSWCVAESFDIDAINDKKKLAYELTKARKATRCPMCGKRGYKMYRPKVKHAYVDDEFTLDDWL